jgi:hypothetical protein
MDKNKLHFITNEFIPLLQKNSANASAKWGKMSFQQMVEHVTDFFKVSTGYTSGKFAQVQRIFIE